MKLTLRYISLLLILTTMGWANDNVDHDKKQCKKPTHQTDNDDKGKHEHDPVPINYSGSTSTSNQTQGQQQNQTTTATASNGAQSNQQVSNTAYQQVRQAPMAYAPDAFSTASCRIGGSVGASSPFGGLALGGSKKDKDCERIALANGFFSRGNYVAGCKLLMHVKIVKEALTMDECVVAVVPQPVTEVERTMPIMPSITVNVPAPVLTPILTVQAEKPTVVNVKPHVVRHSKPCPAPVVTKPACKTIGQLCPVVYRDGVKIIMERV